MKLGSIITLSTLIHLAVFIAFPRTGNMGVTFLYLSIILWASFAFFLTRYIPGVGAAWEGARTAGFLLACAFSALSFLPQANRVSPLAKLLSGRYPSRTSVFTGLLRLGLDCPALLPTKTKEILP